MSSSIESNTKGETLRFLSCFTAQRNLLIIYTSKSYCPTYFAISDLLKANIIVCYGQTAVAFRSVVVSLKQPSPKLYFDLTITDYLLGIKSLTFPDLTTYKQFAVSPFLKIVDPGVNFNC